jgi:hypothetical protein
LRQIPINYTQRENTMNFFDPNYQLPNQKDQFLKFTAGTNKFRFIGLPVTGYEYFVKLEDKTMKLTRLEKNPFTFEELAMLPPSKPGQKPQYFMACCVYDYNSDSFKILSLTQIGLLKSIREYINNPDYGVQIEGYDFTVTKKGEGIKTEYSIIPSPPKPLAKAIAERAKTLQYDLNKLFDDEYPADSFPFEGKVREELLKNG